MAKDPQGSGEGVEDKEERYQECGDLTHSQASLTKGERWARTFFMPITEIGDGLEITKTSRQASGSGTWVCGRLNGHRFSALVFPEHAVNREWEIGDSRISKLWIQRLENQREVYSWDRGLDVPAADEQAQDILGFLCAGLADHTYPD